VTALRIVSVLPELLGTYGDVGNVTVLERRLAWRGIAAEVVTVRIGESVPRSGDLYVLGGGEDASQLAALDGLRRSRLLDSVATRAHAFVVCAGLQLLGTTLIGRGEQVVEGLGLLDIRTTRLHRRVVGEVTATFDAELGLPRLTGFANHAGATVLGPAARPLASVVTGRGNEGGTAGAEGAVQGNVVATYLHGPVLARNPAFADWVLGRALGEVLAPLEPGPAEALHDRLCAAAR
jgi:CobQ-like glutamine amidotransferase family enzyme